MTLRDYQTSCLAEIASHVKQGVNRQLLVLATGLGKALIAASVPDALQLPKNKRMLFLVHRDELAIQAVEKMRLCNPHRTVGMEKAQYRAGDADIVVASVQTLGGSERNGDDWEYSERLRQLQPEQFNIVQADEAHRTSVLAKQWMRVLRYMRVFKGDNPDSSKVLLGWTATPQRADSLGLEAVFDKITFAYDVRKGIENGWLAKITAYRVETEIDLSQVHTRLGDFEIGELTRTVNTRERNELIARKYEEICPGKPALFFTTNIQHSFDLAERLRKHGFKVYPVSGDTPEHDRQTFNRLFKEGKIHGLCSCGIYNEGTDFPACEVGVMARPTKSGLLFRQQAGRILRPYPAPEDLAATRREGREPDRIKQEAIIIDVCDVTGRHSLITTPTLFGLRAKFNGKGKDILAQAKEVEELQEKHPGLDLREEIDIDSIRRKLEALKTSLQKIDLLKPPQTDPEVRRASKMLWLKENEGAYRLGAMSGAIYSVVEDGLGKFSVCVHMKGIKTPLGDAESLSEAVKLAESQLNPRDRKYMSANASWRMKEPKLTQVTKLWLDDRKLRAEFKQPADLHAFVLRMYDSGDLSYSRGGISERIDGARQLPASSKR